MTGKCSSSSSNGFVYLYFKRNISTVRELDE